MPEGVGYGPQDTASVGLNLNVIGNHAYAYSGILDIDNNETTLIEFTSGNFSLVGEWQGYYYEATATSDYRWVLYFNDIKIESFIAEAAIRGNSRSPLKLIIPPFTVVKITGQNVEDSGQREIMASITGRIYGKIK